MATAPSPSSSPPPSPSPSPSPSPPPSSSVSAATPPAGAAPAPSNHNVAGLCLKNRENASRALKRIFDQMNTGTHSASSPELSTHDVVSVDLQLATSGPILQDNKNCCGPQGSAAEKLTSAHSETNLQQAVSFPCVSFARASAFRPLQQDKIKLQIEGILLNHKNAKVHRNETATFQEQPASYSSQGKTESAPYHAAPSITRSTANGQLKAQLTIFYSGTIHVYDDVPADKAHAIMLLAAGSSNSENAIHRHTSSMPFNVAARPACLPSSESKQQHVKRSHTELPYARKASLARFLEKRKDRIHTKAFEFQKVDDNNNYDNNDTVHGNEEVCGPIPELKRLRSSS